ncbi:STAS domain-containing protein [Streptomyces sp. NPDC101213]|uniref:STAS domain-containing protein n=1 Tax=Streptomyces sp. NPDC101213 TaxID=3366130 RepID=UPI0038210854
MRHQDTVVVELPEQVDHDNASLIGAQCEGLIGRGRATLVLDASRVEYLDSSGVSMIIMLSRVVGAHAGTLRVAAFRAHYRKVWHILGLDSLFPVFPTVHAALHAPDGAAGEGHPSLSAVPETPV